MNDDSNAIWEPRYDIFPKERIDTPQDDNDAIQEDEENERWYLEPDEVYDHLRQGDIDNED